LTIFFSTGWLLLDRMPPGQLHRHLVSGPHGCHHRLGSADV